MKFKNIAEGGEEEAKKDGRPIIFSKKNAASVYFGRRLRFASPLKLWFKINRGDRAKSLQDLSFSSQQSRPFGIKPSDNRRH